MIRTGVWTQTANKNPVVESGSTTFVRGCDEKGKGGDHTGSPSVMEWIRATLLVPSQLLGKTEKKLVVGVAAPRCHWCVLLAAKHKSCSSVLIARFRVQSFFIVQADRRPRPRIRRKGLFRGQKAALGFRLFLIGVVIAAVPLARWLRLRISGVWNSDSVRPGGRQSQTRCHEGRHDEGEGRPSWNGGQGKGKGKAVTCCGVPPDSSADVFIIAEPSEDGSSGSSFLSGPPESSCFQVFEA